MKIGITGAEGFIGRHLCAVLQKNGMKIIPFDRAWFTDAGKLAEWTSNCDRIVHLAGLSRHADGGFLYRTNMELARALDSALQQNPRPLYFASTTHFAKDLPYHRSKRDARTLFEQSAKYPVITLRMANLFGPGSRPFYNSAVSTFCALAAAGKEPELIQDVELQLLHIDELTAELRKILQEPEPQTSIITIPHRHTVRLPELWRKLKEWTAKPPVHPAGFDLLLWNTLQAASQAKKQSANSDR